MRIFLPPNRTRRVPFTTSPFWIESGSKAATIERFGIICAMISGVTIALIAMVWFTIAAVLTLALARAASKPLPQPEAVAPADDALNDRAEESASGIEALPDNDASAARRFADPLPARRVGIAHGRGNDAGMSLPTQDDGSTGVKSY